MTKKTTKKHVTAISKIIVTIVTLACIVLGAAVLVQNCWKITKVGSKLMAINSNTQFYNEQTIKTDSMTKDVNQDSNERDSLYKSSDTVTRVFSNLPTLIKGFIWILSILSIPVIPCIAIISIIREIRETKNFLEYEVKRAELLKM